MSSLFFESVIHQKTTKRCYIFPLVDVPFKNNNAKVFQNDSNHTTSPFEVVPIAEDVLFGLDFLIFFPRN
jgi:hypothetical protein